MTRTRSGSPWIRPAVGATVLLVIVVILGPAPILTGLRSLSLQALTLATVLTWTATLACSWRWSAVSQRLGAPLRVREGIDAYYRSQFLNLILPGGILGDAHRALRHGRATGSLGRGVRSVAWERWVGQVVQVALASAVLLTSSSAVRDALRGPEALAFSGGGVVAVGLIVCIVVRTRLRDAHPLVAAAVQDLRRLFCHLPTASRVVAASIVATAAHLTIFLVALHATGTSLPLDRAVPLGFAVLVGSSIPGSLVGWGPREGVAAWAFSAAGLSAADGVAATSLYGLLALLSVMPGALLMLRSGRGGPWRQVRTRASMQSSTQSA